MNTPNQLHTIELLTDLVGFDTTSSKSNLDLIRYIQDYLQRLGVAAELSWNKEQTKANLFATIGENVAPGIVLSGHTDVVPVDGQDWFTDPFKAEIKDGRLYARGSCDMKGFIAVCLGRVRSIIDAGLPIPVHLAFSYDEEVGCVGVQGLIAQLKLRSILPKACIIGEPTSMGVIRAHKGMLFKRCEVIGKAAHSSLVEQGVNAVTAAAKAIHYIDQVAQRIRKQGPFDQQFAPPYTTLHCGVIHGGTVNNIIPERCSFDFEIRNLPAQPTLPVFHEIEQFTKQQLQPAMQAVAAECGFDWSTIADYPGLNTDAAAEVITMVATILEDARAPGKVSYGTEGGHFQAAGVPTVVCGPGSIEQAHKPNEYVDISQLQKCEQFVDALIQSLQA